MTANWMKNLATPEKFWLHLNFPYFKNEPTEIRQETPKDFYCGGLYKLYLDFCSQINDPGFRLTPAEFKYFLLDVCPTANIQYVTITDFSARFPLRTERREAFEKYLNREIAWDYFENTGKQ